MELKIERVASSSRSTRRISDDSSIFNNIVSSGGTIGCYAFPFRLGKSRLAIAIARAKDYKVAPYILAAKIGELSKYSKHFSGIATKSSKLDTLHNYEITMQYVVYIRRSYNLSSKKIFFTKNLFNSCLPLYLIASSKSALSSGFSDIKICSYAVKSAAISISSFKYNFVLYIYTAYLCIIINIISI